MTSRVSTEVLSDGSVGLRIRAERPIVSMLFVSVWLSGWTVGGIFAIRDLVRSIEAGRPEMFLTLWLCIWVVPECWVGLVFSWMMLGAEVISFRDGELRWKRDLFGYGPVRSWPVDSIRKLQASESLQSFWTGRKPLPWGSRAGTVVFESAGRQHRIGASLDEVQSQEVVTALKSYLPTV